MQRLFRNEEETLTKSARASGVGLWPTRLLGFAGSAVIFWVSLRFLAPVLAGAWGVIWLKNSSAQIVLAVLLAVPFAALLARIEGTIWGKYYVTIGYLLAFALIVWIVLRLLRYI